MAATKILSCGLVVHRWRRVLLSRPGGPSPVLKERMRQMANRMQARGAITTECRRRLSVLLRTDGRQLGRATRR